MKPVYAAPSETMKPETITNVAAARSRAPSGRGVGEERDQGRTPPRARSRRWKSVSGGWNGLPEKPRSPWERRPLIDHVGRIEYNLAIEFPPSSSTSRGLRGPLRPPHHRMRREPPPARGFAPHASWTSTGHGAVGYTLSSEEHGPGDLPLFGRVAEEAGFDFLTVSDHFHPWTSRQGQSPFVWSVLGGLSVKTEEIPVVTGVTCPTIRIHPAIVAQAAAHHGVPATRPVHAGRGHRRKPERARPGR